MDYRPLSYSKKHRYYTSEGWGLFLLLPEELPARMLCAFRTFFWLNADWYVVELLLPLVGNICDVLGLFESEK